MCCFTPKQLTRHDTNWMVFEATRDSRRLGILFPLGSIEYETRETYSPTNLVRGVPTEAEVLQMATNILRKLGVGVLEIEKKQGSEEPDIHVFDSRMMFFVNRAVITNLIYRGIRFRRSVDGAPFVGNGTGGNGDIRFGDHGKVCYISLSWRNLQRYRTYPTASPETVTKWIRQGKAVQNMIPMDAEPINWSTVKSVTVTAAKVCYDAGSPFEPSDCLMPFVALRATVDRGDGTIDVEIDCPIIDETGAAKRATPPTTPGTAR